MRALVFCEHHDGALTKGALGLLAKAAQIGADCQAPIKMVSSAGKPLKPGMPIEARPARTKVSAANGNRRCSGRARRAESCRVCVRS